MNDEGHKFTRRDFLRVGAGAAGGASLLVAKNILDQLMGGSTNLDSIDAEGTQVAHQRQKEEHISATAEAADSDWNELRRNGFPEKAIESAVKVYVMEIGDKLANAGSGSIIEFELDGGEYWGILTVKHILKDVSIDNLISGWERPGNIPNGGKGVAVNVGVGTLENEDVAILIYGEEADPPLDGFFDHRVFSLDDLAFEKYSPKGKKVYGVDYSYPAMIVNKAHVVVGEKVMMEAWNTSKPFEKDGLWHIDGTQLEAGSSGMGVVDQDEKLIGVESVSYGYEAGKKYDASYYPGFTPLKLVG